MHRGAHNTQRRGSIVLLTLLIALAMVGEALVPAIAVADGKHDGKSHNKAERLHQAKAAWKRGDVHTQVVGGKVVPQGTDSFMAFVLLDTDEGTFQCGGSLIDPSFVLTAAHCVDDGTGNPLPGSAFTVIIGKADINEATDANVRGVTEAFLDPDWNPDGVPEPDSFANDAALLKLDEAVSESLAKVLPIVGSGDTRFDGAGEPVGVAGWGTTSENGPASDQLREADLNIVSDGSCSASYGSDFNADSMICAAFIGRDSCQGDSGGPLFAKEVVGQKTVKKKGRHGKHHKHHRKKKKVPVFADIETGIVSFGEGCAEPNFPGVYTRLSSPAINNFITGVLNN